MTDVVHLHTYHSDTDWLQTGLSTACGLDAYDNPPCIPAWEPRKAVAKLRTVCPRCLHAVGAPGTGRWGTPPEPPPVIDSHHLLALTSPLEPE